MELFTIGRISIRCSVFCFVFIAIAFILEAVGIIITLTIVLTLHEACHTLVALKLGIEVSAIEIQPFGFVARLKTKNIPCTDELAIAAAGPIFSLISGFSVVALMQLVSIDNQILWDFALISVSIGILNLLPALPLDGGRILAAILERITSYRTALLITAWLGIIIATASIFYGVIILLFYATNVTLLIMGLFLFFAALREIRLSKTSKISAMIRRANSLRFGHSLKIKQIVLHKGVYAVDALKMLNTNNYNNFVVLDDCMERVGEFNENELLKALASMGNDITVEEAVSFTKNKGGRLAANTLDVRDNDLH